MDKYGTIVFSVVGLAHGHIYQMTEGLIYAGAILKYVYDENKSSLKEFVCRYRGAVAVNSYEEILNDNEVDLVVIADIPCKRASVAIRAMNSGKNVFTAKAPFITSEQKQKVEETINLTQKKYFVYYSERLASEAAMYACNAIKSGIIGKVINVEILAPHRLGSRPEWFFKKECSGGIFVDIGSHQFEQFLYYTGNDNANIIAATIRKSVNESNEEYECFGDVYLKGENGATGYIRVDWLTPDSLPVFGDGRVFILGEKGFIELRKYIDIGSGNTEVVIVCNDAKCQKVSVKDITKITFFNDLLDDILNGGNKTMSLHHTLYTMELALKTQEVAESGKIYIV